MEQVASSHFTDEETEGACLMCSGYYMAVAILLSLSALLFILFFFVVFPVVIAVVIPVIIIIIRAELC